MPRRKAVKPERLSQSFVPTEVDALCMLMRREMKKPDGGHLVSNEPLQSVYRKFLAMQGRANQKEAC